MKKISTKIKKFTEIFKEHLYFKYWGVQYRNYPLASNIKEMVPFADWIKNWSTLKVKNIFEIGANYEVLDGFGSRLGNIGAIHIESEHVEAYEGETLWNGIKEKLENAGFEMVYFQRYKCQSDSLWLQKRYLLSK